MARTKPIGSIRIRFPTRCSGKESEQAAGGHPTESWAA